MSAELAEWELTAVLGQESQDQEHALSMCRGLPCCLPTLSDPCCPSCPVPGAPPCQLQQGVPTCTSDICNSLSIYPLIHPVAVQLSQVLQLGNTEPTQDWLFHSRFPSSTGTAMQAARSPPQKQCPGCTRGAVLGRGSGSAKPWPGCE